MRDGDYFMFIAKVSGTPYEMGYAVGQLYGNEIADNVDTMFAYGHSMAAGFLTDIGAPDIMANYIGDLVVNLANYLLDLNYQVAAPYTPQRYIDEIQGMADGTNGKVDFIKLRRINFLPEIIKAACTIVGVHGSATENGNLYHLRALDWDASAPVSKYPSIIIYDSVEPNSNVFANIGFLGMVGALTAISKNGISVGEKVFYSNDPTKFPVEPETTYYGKPW
jgi:hypothetical protein